MSRFVHRESVKHDAAKKMIAKWIEESKEAWQVKCDNHKPNMIKEAIIGCNSIRKAHLTTGQSGSADWVGTHPSFEEMSNAGLGIVLAVSDIMLSRKGKLDCMIEICAANPVSDEKMEVIERRIIKEPIHLIEVDADWVMKQSSPSQPPVLVSKRILLLEQMYMSLPYRDDGENSCLSHEDAIEEEKAKQEMYAMVFGGTGDPENRMEYSTNGNYIFKGKDKWGNVV